jgi:hypothetical protein
MVEGEPEPGLGRAVDDGAGGDTCELGCIEGVVVTEGDLPPDVPGVQVELGAGLVVGPPSNPGGLLPG